MDARHEIEARLAEQRRLRGVAIANGSKPRNSADIAALQVQLEAIDDAEAAIARRDRESCEVERIQRVNELKTELRASCAAYLEDIRHAEVAVRAAAAAISQTLEAAKAMARTCHAISGKPSPLNLGEMDVARRMGASVAAEMSGIPDHKHRLGSQEWPPGHYTSASDWVTRESALIDCHVKPLTE
jgi:hypothetical protein